MNDTLDLQNGGCGRVAEPQTTRGAVVAGAVATLLAMSAYASANGPGEPGSPRVGLNQSVALEQAEPAPGVAPVFNRCSVSTSAASAHDLPEGQENVARGMPTPGSTQQHRMLRKRPRPEAHSIEPQAVTTPWHRTGLGALTIVLAIVGGLYYLVRRCVPSLRTTDHGAVRVVGRTSLTPKHHVALIQLGRRFLAVGMSGDRMATLCEVRDPAEVAELAARAGAQALRGRNGFDDLLLHETAEYHEPSDQADEAPVATSAAVSASRRPVKDLLQRLQTLRSKK